MTEHTMRPLSTSDAPVQIEAGFTTLQDMIWPEQGICTERDLYVRLSGPAGWSAADRSVHFATGGRAEFNTWFNLFNIGKWVQHCGLEDIHLALRGQGRFELTVTLALQDRSWERLVNEMVELDPVAPLRIDLSQAHEYDREGVLFFELRALDEGRLAEAAWQTRQAPRRQPELALSITTFRREAAVQRTVARFEDYIAASPLREHMRLIVVDNGQSVEIADSPHVTVIPNENLGGAGGFARGLLAARDGGASHCLFMDDDASIHMASLDRTWQFLAYASDPGTAVAASMINATHRWAIWESGALFNTRCMPLHMGTDLRDPGDFFEMEYETTARAPDNFYGGWWFFAFPLDRVRHLPFPFFVRGDDVSFSLVHDFNIVTLNGVVSFQDSFTDKESPQTWYLDMRSHMAHHLSLPMLHNGAAGTYRIAVWFFLRNIIRMHYDTLAAVNLAVEDVMRGPGFFAEHADMAKRRGDIKALTRDEAWEPREKRRDLPRDRMLFNPDRWLPRLLMKVSVNGHLLPFFSLYGNRITLKAEDRGKVRKVWGAAQITYLDATQRKSYTVTHSKAKALVQGLRLLRNGLRFALRYKALRAEWQQGYEELTASDGFWREKMKLAPAPQATAQERPETAEA
ncbi:MAG: glycosyltransferase family 2 protein [Paracoccaceae bacterium]